MALLSIFRGTQAECAARPVSDGALLFATDTKKIYLDKDSTRIEMGSAGELGDYITQEELEEALSGKADKTHIHTQDQITGLEDALAGKAPVSHSHAVASTNTAGFMSAEDKEKLDGIPAGGSQYTLPVATYETLGGVRVRLTADTNYITENSDRLMMVAATDSSTPKSGLLFFPASDEFDGKQGLLKISSISGSKIQNNSLSSDKIEGTIPDSKLQAINANKITGTIPQSILPSYVDDVLEYANKSSFPGTGEAGKIYVDLSTNLTYRWGGSSYVEISPSLALGTTSSTAFRGDYGNTAYQHAAAKGSAFASGLYKITTNSQGHVTAATAVTKSDITALGIPGQDTNTWIAFKGATTSAAGTAGYAPAPAAGAANRYLRSDGTWAVPPDTNTDTNTTYTLTKSGSTITLTGSNGSKTSVTDSNTTYSLSSFGITATAAEINKLDGLTATTTELNYVDGVTSNIQTQLNGKAASSHSHNYAGSSSAGGAATSAAKLNGVSLAGKNLNDYHSGVNFYWGGEGNNCTNKPSGVDNFGMFVFQSASGWWTQLLYGSDDHLYMRRWASNSWTSWVEIYSSNNKPTASEIGAAAASHNHSAANITSGTLAVARGGTGITASPSMLTNLGSTTAAGVFQASPRPGITGTLSIAHGGTGATTAAAARSALGAAAYSHTHSYLSLGGGTVTGQIKKAGASTSWYTGRDVAMIRTTSCADTAYNPLWSAKSYQGSWECGPYTSNTLHFSYITDTNYSKKNNAQTADIQFTTAGAVIANTFQGALSGNASTATKLQTTRTIALSGDVTGSASFNGSANATISTQIAANAVGTNEIAANAVTASEIASGAVGTSEIASNAVTLAKLGSDVGTIAVQSSTPTDANVKLWIQI